MSVSPDLIISRNEFDTLDQALAAQTEFQGCGTCKVGVKVQVIGGRFLVLCIARPQCHNGIRRYNV